MKLQLLDNISILEKHSTCRLHTPENPLCSFQYLNAMELSGSAVKETGWQPNHFVTLGGDGSIDEFLPAYVKTHSWGEYVFDWSWADAYQHYNLEYYPKLVCAIPFTPVPCQKQLTNTTTAFDTFELLTQHCLDTHLNSWHLLFCEKLEQDKDALMAKNVFYRNTVQFHWFNRGYQSFEDFLATFTARKRKNTKKERLSISQQGVSVRSVKGIDASKEDIDFFYLTYQTTYLKKGHQPHLTLNFFHQIFTSMADNIVLMIASKDEKDIATALFFYDNTTLYGRYWGCIEPIKNLHFELCYYQGIEFCIQHQLQVFNPGTQGEHKIQRGFEPVLTHSYHWVKHPMLRAAIDDFCQRECEQMQSYFQQCQQALPFKQAIKETE